LISTWMRTPRRDINVILSCHTHAVPLPFISSITLKFYLIPPRCFLDMTDTAFVVVNMFWIWLANFILCFWFKLYLLNSSHNLTSIFPPPPKQCLELSIWYHKHLAKHWWQVIKLVTHSFFLFTSPLNKAYSEKKSLR
jgi:hypothetical protein